MRLTTAKPLGDAAGNLSPRFSIPHSPASLRIAPQVFWRGVDAATHQLRGQTLMPELGAPPEKTVFISGVGCAGRFVYYMDTYPSLPNFHRVFTAG